MISRRTIWWFVLFLVLASGVALRMDWEIATCREYIRQHAYQSPGIATGDESNTVTLSFDPCQPGELEPWWAKIFILGAFVAFLGTIIRFAMDIRIWFRRARV